MRTRSHRSGAVAAFQRHRYFRGMGVEYTHYLVPKQITYRPSAERVSRFAASLVANGWLFEPGTPRFKQLVSGGNYDPGALYAKARKTGAMFADAGGSTGSAPATPDATWLRRHKQG